eukprot:TRINITY_DN1914_c0_g1_i2.p2 TRINITY_DN1914_c0_g1~~TRINITY_DN1914_c0_g1_i2.p2  ORF type:complete len:118 (+),score=7.14 TRINITY_DN1914_c0_g1_i2:308-661(+)
MRSCCCPCLQIALNDAVLEGTITHYPVCCCICCNGLPGGMNCCDVCFACCNPCCVEYQNRQRIRRTFKIAADPIDDCCKVVFCPCCAIAQDAHMLEANASNVQKFAAAGGSRLLAGH